ncbi:MAG TPA: hypothetical protein VI643_00285 [Planctomycetota bacterium]|nr:hypothetical protein [Planctomycetota bacterium]
MPIRHCQLCGIKVIVDEDKASVFPFYCDLCSTKTQMGGAAVPEPGRSNPPTPPPPSVEAPSFPSTTPLSSAPADEEAKPLSCPSCSAGLPLMAGSKPIKSRCPGCAAEVAVLPTGEVKLIEGEDPLKFAKTQEVEIDEGTEGLKAKIRLLIDREKKKTAPQAPVAAATAQRSSAPPPAPTAAASVSGPSGPKILIKAPNQAPRQPTPARLPPMKANTPVSNPRIDAPPPEKPSSLPTEGSSNREEVASHIPTELRSGFIGGDAASTSDTEAAAPLRSDEPTPQKLDELPDLGGGEPPSPGGGFLPQTTEGSADKKPEVEEEEESAAPRFTGPRQRRIPVIMAWILLLAPIALAVIVPKLENAQINELLEKLGATVETCTQDITKFVTAQWDKMNEPPPPPPTPIDPVTKAPKATPEEMQMAMVDDYRKYLKSVMRYAEEQESAKFADILQTAKRHRDDYTRVRDKYTDQTQKDAPIGPEIKSDLEDAIVKMHERIKFTEHFAKKAPEESKVIMMEKVRAMEQAKTLLDTDYRGFFNAAFKIPDINDPAPRGPSKEEARDDVQKKYQKWQDKKKEVDAKGELAPTLDKTFVTVFEKQYLKAKEDYEAKFGETFAPK